MEVRLKNGFVFSQEAIALIMDAPVSSIQWSEKPLDPAPGMESLEETILWPTAIGQFVLPQERIVFIRQVADTTDQSVGYCVESLADATQPGKTTFFPEDFTILLSTSSRGQADSMVLSEIQRYIRSNLE